MAKEKIQKGKIGVEKMMKIYMKLSIPGAPHKRLASLAGNWTTKTTAWMEPEKPPVESKGTCKQKMILGGRFLQQEYTGAMVGNKFTGINLIGYDNHTKKYVSIWIDSMSTGIYYFEGIASRNGKTITQESRYDDPVRGPMTWRSISKVVNNKTMVYEMYIKAKGGKEEKMMEMIMTRKS